MSDLFYNFVWSIGCPAFLVSSRPTVINVQVTRRPGAYILASNHASPYDVPLLMRHSKRKLDFVSSTEIFRNPFVAWFYGSMNAFPLNRSRADAATVRVILDRLKRGRAVAMFPEGQFRTAENSVLSGGPIRPGIGRIAQLADVPIIPCVVLNSSVYYKFQSWLPRSRVWYGLIYGQPMNIDPALDPELAGKELEARLCVEFKTLCKKLQAAGAI